MTTREAWLNVNQAAEAMGVSPGTVYEMVEKNLITHFRIGAGRGKIVFRPADLEAYLESRRGGPKPRKEPVVTPRRTFPEPMKDHFAKPRGSGRRP